MIIGDHVYIVEENGLPHCYELTTGKEVWKVGERPGSGTTWGSMVHAGVGSTSSCATATRWSLRRARGTELLATNPLGRGEHTNASPAVSDGEFFLRTFGHLWCIAERK